MRGSHYFRLLREHGITELYHLTSRRNLASIASMGGLYSWYRLVQRGVQHVPASNPISRELDVRKGLQDYIRLAVVPYPPMFDLVTRQGRVHDLTLLTINITDLIQHDDLLFSSTNATANRAHILELPDPTALGIIHRIRTNHQGYDPMTSVYKLYAQAEIMVRGHLPVNLNAVRRAA